MTVDEGKRNVKRQTSSVENSCLRHAILCYNSHTRFEVNPRVRSKKPRLVREDYGGEIYEYYPLGEYVVVAPGVCGGRPTFKYTRLEVSIILALLASGITVKEILRRYRKSRLNSGAIFEAVALADRALENSARLLQVPA